MENHKKNHAEIDEMEMMNLMVDGVKKEGLTQKEKSKDKQSGIESESSSNKKNPPDKVRNKKETLRDYEAIFFKKIETQARDGKTVYIRPEFHEKLTRIVQVIGEDKISIYAYLDNLLDFHFQEFGESITKSFNEKYKPIL